MQHGADVGVFASGAQRRTVPAVAVELALALFHRLVQTFESDHGRVGLLVAELDLVLGQTGNRPAERRVYVGGRVDVHVVFGAGGLQRNLLGRHSVTTTKRNDDNVKSVASLLTPT